MPWTRLDICIMHEQAAECNGECQRVMDKHCFVVALVELWFLKQGQGFILVGQGMAENGDKQIEPIQWRG